MNRSLENTAETFTVNKFARRARHMRVFSKNHVLRMHAVDAFKYLSKPFIGLYKTPAFKGFRRFLNRFLSYTDGLIPVAPQKRLFAQAGAIALSALIVTSLTPGATFTAASMTYNSEYLSAYAVEGNVLISDESGYLVKVNPQTDSANRVGLTDYAVHTVESGEVVGTIAEKYGVSASTIVWENSLANNGNSIRIGQKLMIPPVDGLSYKVVAGDSLEKIAAKYEISAEAIIAQNSLESEVLTKGQSIFLPGAEPLYTPPIASSSSVGTGARAVRTDYAPSGATPAVGKIFIFPTNGKITQGYRGGHYALDIADRSKPPVWAGAAGTVIKSSTGTWGGGYGNHVIIDHGNGMTSLYAHLDTVNVSVGQWLNQGDVLGVMGNTGRVYGVTGIHLHWEVTSNGVKVNPYNYY